MNLINFFILENSDIFDVNGEDFVIFEGDRFWDNYPAVNLNLICAPEFVKNKILLQLFYK